MKRLSTLLSHICLLACLLAAPRLPALAAGAPDAPDADSRARLEACLTQAYPDTQLFHATILGDTAAAAMEQGGAHILCVLDRLGGEWTISVQNPTALRQDKPLPGIALGDDGRLSWLYPGEEISEFITWRDPDGGWQPVSKLVRSAAGDGKTDETQVVWRADGRIMLTQRVYDSAHDLLYGVERVECYPAPWLEGCIRLEDFDVSRFPVFTEREYWTQWPDTAFFRDAAAYLLPGYAFVGGSLASRPLAPDSLQFLMDRPDGARVFVGCHDDGELRLCESAPLPPSTAYGYENFGTSLNVDGLCVTLGRSGPRWYVHAIMGEAIDVRLGDRCLIGDDATNTIYLGRHPWSDVTSIDWRALPKTTSEAISRVDGEGYAIVHNPDPADRLHLREGPDRGARSLGKYYNGTPAEVLEVAGDWARVDVLGQQGWMMKAYLDFHRPYATADAMPALRFRNPTATLYERPDRASEGKTLDSDYGLLVIGVLDGGWLRV